MTLSFSATHIIRRALCIAVPAAILLAASHPGVAQDRPVSGGTLTWGVETQPATLNPQLNGQAKVTLLLRNVYESLLARNPDGSFVPWLAKGFSISADGKTYTFTLRDDVVFTDGTPFDAQVVVSNLLKLADPSYSNGLGFSLLGSHFRAAKALDAHSVAITLDEPYTPFLTLIGRLPLVSPKALAQPDLKSGGTDVAGTGPFILRRYVKGQEIDFDRNPAYRWAPPTAAHQGPAYLDHVVYRFLPESSVRLGALLSGQVDVIEGIAGNDVARVRSNPDFTYRHALNIGTPYSLFLNTSYGPTQDQKVRRALLEGLDVTGVVQSIYHGERTRAWGISAPVDPLYDRSIERTYGNNPALANALLDQAGWTARDAAGYRARQGARLTVTVLESQSTLRDQRDVLLQALQAQARQRLGVDLQIQLLDQGSWISAYKSGAYGAFSNSTTLSDGIDIEYHWLPFGQGGVLNLSHASAPELGRWLQAASRTQNAAERKKLYGELQNFVVNQQACVIPLYVPEDQIAAASAVQGIRFRSFDQMPENAYDVWLRK